MNKYGDDICMCKAKKLYKQFKLENPESRKSFRTYARDALKKVQVVGKLKEIISA